MRGALMSKVRADAVRPTSPHLRERTHRMPLEIASVEVLSKSLRPCARYLKARRFADIILVILASPLCVVLILLAGMGIALTMGRPIFYSQLRVGQGGRRFMAFKLRTMLPTGGEAVATCQSDRRITGFGKVLRRWHVDELPQFWNILRGDMTLIGPRPEWCPLAKRYSKHFPQYDIRHLVTPGLTGWAQVQQGNVATLEDAALKAEYDLFYISNLSLSLDLRILFMTIVALLNPKLSH